MNVEVLFEHLCTLEFLSTSLHRTGILSVGVSVQNHLVSRSHRGMWTVLVEAGKAAHLMELPVVSFERFDRFQRFGTPVTGETFQLAMSGFMVIG